MKVILYSNDCPRCRVLKKKLTDKHVVFETQSDMTQVYEFGLTELPVMVVKENENASVMQFADAVKWVNELPGGSDPVQDEIPHFCATCRLDPDSDRR